MISAYFRRIFGVYTVRISFFKCRIKQTLLIICDVNVRSLRGRYRTVEKWSEVDDELFDAGSQPTPFRTTIDLRNDSIQYTFDTTNVAIVTLKMHTRSIFIVTK